MGIRQGLDALTVWIPSGLASAALFMLVISMGRQALARRTLQESSAATRVPGSGAWRLRVAKTPLVLMVCALGLVGVRVYAMEIEPYRLQVREVVISSDKVARELRVLHISDIQSFRVGAYEQRAFARMRELRPDLVLFTGDLLQCGSDTATAQELPKLAALFAGLDPPLGKLGVLGNCDGVLRRVSGDESPMGGLRVLDGRAVVIHGDGVRIDVLGLTRPAAQRMDDGGGPIVGADPAIRQWLDGTPSRGIRIVMGHYPDFVLRARDLPIDLCLAGHTHGGQVRLPFLGPAIEPDSIPRWLAWGHHVVGSTRIDVSAGIGCRRNSGLPPLRFNCPPEMTLIRFTPGRSAHPDV